MFKTIVIYGHLIATCLAIGSAIRADFTLWRGRHSPLSEVLRNYLVETQTVVIISLALLWCSGLLLVYIGYLNEGIHYLLNPKLWAKASVVILLTINGWLLHRIGFPLLDKSALVLMPKADKLKLSLLGTISAGSWLFAAFLGIARPWSHNLPYLHIMSVFIVALALAITFTAALQGVFSISVQVERVIYNYTAIINRLRHHNRISQD